MAAPVRAVALAVAVVLAVAAALCSAWPPAAVEQLASGPPVNVAGAALLAPGCTVLGKDGLPHTFRRFAGMVQVDTHRCAVAGAGVPPCPSVAHGRPRSSVSALWGVPVCMLSFEGMSSAEIAASDVELARLARGAEGERWERALAEARLQARAGRERDADEVSRRREVLRAAQQAVHRLRLVAAEREAAAVAAEGLAAAAERLRIDRRRRRGRGR